MTNNPKPWGKITWYFLHTFCEKIDEEYFIQNKTKCIEILETVCNIIPCPLCRVHASKYLKQNPMNKLIHSKEDLKNYFFKFHNNATKQANPQSKEENILVLEIYKKAIFPNIIKNFKYEYTKSTPTRLDYTHTLFTHLQIKEILSFIYSIKDKLNGTYISSNIQQKEQKQETINNDIENIKLYIS